MSDVIDEEFTKRGITYQSKKRSVLGINYYNLTWNQSIASRVHFPFSYPPTVTVYDGKGIISQKQSSFSSKEKQPVTVQVQNLSLYYPAMNISAENLSGMIYPTIELSSATLSITRTNGKTDISGTFPHPLQGDDVTLTIARKGNDTTFSASIPSFSYKHPLLSQNAVKFPKSEISGRINGSKLTGTVQNLDSIISIYGTVDLFTKVAQLEYEGSIPLNTLHNLFPLLKELSLSGEFRVAGTFHWPKKDWSLFIDSNELAVNGKLFDPLPYKHGPFQHSSPSTGTTYISGPQTSSWTNFDDLGWLAKTAVAAEDSAFWSHNGYSTKSMEEAIQDFQKKDILRGGSTITQQLAKNLFLSSEKTMERKVHELLYAISLETFLNKKEILTLYLNIVEFGPNIHGIHKASQAYFLKKPSSLSIVEAAYLASVLPAPTRFFSLAQKSKRIPRRRTDRILQNLLDAKVITKNEYIQALETPLRVLAPTE